MLKRQSRSPTPLDCLIVSHLFVILHALKPTHPMRRAIETDSLLKDYIERMMAPLAKGVA